MLSSHQGPTGIPNEGRRSVPRTGMLPDLRSLLRAGASATQPLLLKRMARLTEASQDGILLIDQKWRIVYANKIAQVQARITSGELNRAVFWDLYPTVVGTALEEAYRHVMTTGEYRFLEAYHYPPFDTWADVNIVPMESGIAIYFRDVSSRIKMQMTRDRATEQLHQVLEATTDSVMSVDRNWCVRYMNGHAKVSLAGKGEMLGKNLWECFPEAVFEGSPDVYHHYRAMDEGLPGEFQTYSPGELQARFNVIVRPSQAGIIIFFRDVTRQKRAEAALVEVEKLALASQLSSAIAHEINNPLASVTNLLFLARERATVPEVIQYLDMAEREMRRATGVTSHSLRFHRQLSLPQPVHCQDLFQGVLATFESRLGNAGVTVEKRKRARIPVICLEGDIRQVLNELVSNALAGMPEGGRLQVRSREGTDTKTGQRGLTLTVADNGTGISAAHQAQIFDAFLQQKASEELAWVCGSARISSSGTRVSCGYAAVLGHTMARW